MAQDTQFENRKRDHLRIALREEAQSETPSGLSSIQLVHEALPELDFQEIELGQTFGSHVLSAPFLISSMTAGHVGGRRLNVTLAKFASERRLLMGVGSQRRELEDPSAAEEWTELRREAPDALLIANVGISQAIRHPVANIRRLVESLRAVALFVHLNPLQECVQPEGTPQFRGGLEAIRRLSREVGVPVIVKETGSGFSAETLKRLDGSGIAAVDVAGVGGTHWGRVETRRRGDETVGARAGRTFDEWGVSTLQSLLNAKEQKLEYEVWASGGIRSGLDVAKCLALGAQWVGLAQPWLQAAVADQPEKALRDLADRLELELKTALFCTGARTPNEMRAQARWTWQKP